MLIVNGVCRGIFVIFKRLIMFITVNARQCMNVSIKHLDMCLEKLKIQAVQKKHFENGME